PSITWSYQPAANVPADYARAISQPGRIVPLRSDASQLVTVSLSQTFEGKLRPRGTDTTAAEARKLRILSIATSGVSYDFEQAKKPGFNGWATQTLTNSILSDLLPGFNLSLTHDLWRGQVGVDTSSFSPFLQNVSTSFSPTPFWALSWSSQYNITDGKFESQVVRLEREMHDWRAGFNFLRNPNGNFAFYFTIYLTDLPELKFDYDQTTIER